MPQYRIHGRVCIPGVPAKPLRFVKVEELTHPLNGRVLAIAKIREGTALRENMPVSFTLSSDRLGSGTFADDVAELSYNEIILSERNWWDEIGRLKLPEELKGLLRTLVSDVLNDCIMPRVEERVLELAKEHLSDTSIRIGGRHVYSVVVYMPYNQDSHHPTFFLVPTYPQGILRRLDEFY